MGFDTPLGQLIAIQGWVRSALIKELCPDTDAKVVQIGGSGRDTDKWSQAKISFLFDIEQDTQNSKEAEACWIDKNSPYVAKFVDWPLEESWQSFPESTDFNGSFNMVLAGENDIERKLFKSRENLTQVLGNISNLLQPGGFWTGICMDSSEIWQRLHKTNSSKISPKQALKNSFTTEMNLMKVEVKNVSGFMDGDHVHQLIPNPSMTTAEWIAQSPAVGLEYILTMEGSKEDLYLIHVATLVEAAKAVGLKCISFRNLAEFYNIFKRREDEQFKKMSIVNKENRRVSSEQKDAMQIYAVYVFQKI